VIRYRAQALALAATLFFVSRAAWTAPRNDTSDPQRCIERTTAALQTTGAPATRLQRAACEEALGRLVEARADAQEALGTATLLHDATTARGARARIRDLTTRIPLVAFEPPSDASDLRVTFDGQPVPADRLGGSVAVNPGRHFVHAEGTADGVVLVFDRRFEIREQELERVTIVLIRPKSGATAALKRDVSANSDPNVQGEEEAPRRVPPANRDALGNAKYLTAGQLRCLLAAKSQEEVNKCLPRKSANLAVKTGFDISGYSDTTNVNVLSPEIVGSVASPTAGWNIGGSYLVDVVSAASPDIVSEASPPFHEIRQAGSLSGGYKPGIYGAQLQGNVSSEPDYLSIGGGIALTAELNDKLTTPRVAFNYSHDTIGRSTTPFSVFHHNLDTSEFEAGCTFVMSPTSVLLLSGTVQLESGDQSKPYRYIPMFFPATAANVKPGQSYASVNSARESIRPLEQLPLDRERYAAGARFAHRFDDATLRIEERIYADSWQQYATTTDFRLMADVTDRLRLWPHLRVNLQNGVYFYRLAYSPIVDPTTTRIAVPTLRTTDREDSPMVAVTGGGGARFALTPSTSSTLFAITLQGDVLYSKYFQSLYITSRTAVYVTLGLEAEFE
jgi:hypothetical protein